jgi:hypothetical protein
VIYVERSFMLQKSKFTYTYKNKMLTLALRVTQFMFSPSTKNAPNYYYDSLSKKISMCQKSMSYENISMPKCMRKRKHTKEHDAYKKRK